jgi:hypothetical protein
LLPPLPVVPDAIRYRRQVAGGMHNIEFHPDVSLTLQYRPPSQFTRRMLETYSRFVALNVKNADHPDMQVTGVKVYRIIHNILLPGQLAQGVDPNEEILYQPYYMGEYTVTGQLKDPDDPYLFWLIPRYVKPHAPFNSPYRRKQDADAEDFRDCLVEHIKVRTRTIDPVAGNAIP